MFISANEKLPEWSSDDAAVLRDFIASSTGQKLLVLLASMSPSLLDGSDVNKTLVASGEVKGYTLAISNIHDLRTTRPEEASGQSDNYPSLDDDSKWDSSSPTQPQTP